MKLATMILVASLIGLGSAYAEETKQPATDSPIKTLTEKKERKKKVAMCAECGKPESECECDGHKKDEKKK